MTTTTKVSHTDNDTKEEGNHHHGIWIGIDLGTSNCAAAVWDSSRGRPKWMRLQGIAYPPQNASKVGRIVPSAVCLGTPIHESTTGVLAVDTNSKLWFEIQDLNPQWTQTKLQASVGHVALQLREKNNSNHYQVISSIKRVLSVADTTKLSELDSDFRASLPFELEETNDGTWVVQYSLPKNNHNTTIHLRPIHVAAILLQAIRTAANQYLKQTIPKKQMEVPGGNKNAAVIDNIIQNVALGVPAYFGQSARHSVEQAARLAGFTGQVSTLTESTAAAMAYGLFVSRSEKSILVLDMGGGTTDITIAEMRQRKERQSDDDNLKFQVLLTDGDPRLGGDDMDNALCERVLRKEANTNVSLNPQQRQSLTLSCQKAKEALCGNIDEGDAPVDQATLTIPKDKEHSVTLTQADLAEALKPILQRLKELVQHALDRYSQKTSDSTIQEVILVGGATRVPAVRQTLQSIFPKLELCTSVNPMSAVAQGTAIQAAILSKQVPLHQIQSALMLDTTPHAIGVLSAGGDFCEILPRDSPLPAKGYATFSLADIHQRGVTVQAVEQVRTADHHDHAVLYQPLGDFTFLLHKIPPDQLKDLENHSRQVDIGMTLNEHGEFQVSIFDPHDPDHQRKKRFKGSEVGVLDYVHAAATDGSMTAEELKLVVMAISLFCFYLFAKLAIPKDDATILEEGANIL